mmetsp:Transcript_25158/g.57277  ORF Transcript_25158/g.57277 Transcript_25158/m.57277 type:complete len:259 (-) Transcript_25158:694-1470(-)
MGPFVLHQPPQQIRVEQLEGILPVDDLQHSAPSLLLLAQGLLREVLDVRQHALVSPYIALDLIERVAHTADRSKLPERLFLAIHAHLHHPARAARRGEEERRIPHIIHHPRVGTVLLREVVVHGCLAMQDAAVQHGVVHHHARELGLSTHGALVARVHIGVLSHQVVNDVNVAETRGETEYGAAKVQVGVGVGEAPVRVYVLPLAVPLQVLCGRSILDQKLDHLEVLLNDRKMQRHLPIVRLAEIARVQHGDGRPVRI